MGSVGGRHNVIGGPPWSTAAATSTIGELPNMRRTVTTQLPVIPAAPPPQLMPPLVSTAATNVVAIGRDLPRGMYRPMMRVEDFCDVVQLYEGYASTVYRATCRRVV